MRGQYDVLVRILAAQRQAEAADRGDDWLLNLPRYRQFEDSLDAINRMGRSPWTPARPQAEPVERMPVYTPLDMLNRRDFPPPRTRKSY